MFINTFNSYSHISLTSNFFLRLGLPKAQYAVGYFTEMGIGCRCDPLESNVWYVRAADQGDERAKQRIAAIQDAASGADSHSTGKKSKASKSSKKSKASKPQPGVPSSG